MKKLQLFLMMFLIAALPLFAEETAKDIIKKSKAVQEVPNSWSMGEQTILTSGGSKRTFDIEMWTKDKADKQLMEYKSPARVKGVKFLFLDDSNEIYTYFPKTDRVRHLASHMKRQKMMGSDFSYEDMSFGKLDRDYKSFKKLSDEKQDGAACHVVEMIPSDKGPHYSKMVVWVDKATWVTRRIDYYEDGKLLKRMTASDIREIDKVPTAFVVKMKNLQDGGETEIVTKEINYSKKNPDSIFTVHNLKRR